MPTLSTTLTAPTVLRSFPSLLGLLALAIPVALLACASPSPNGDASTRQVLVDAVAHSGRPASDRVDDANRKPVEVLEAIGIRPGMRVLDLLAGGGYYSEILSRAVGTQGSVVFHNNRAYREYVTPQELAKRTVGGRLPNVEILDTEVADLAFRPGELDAVVFILGFHDLYLVVDDGSWPVIEVAPLLQTLFEGLRPGGVLGIVDHSAVAGSDPHESANGPHRIDEAFVRKLVEGAGFVSDSASDALRHPEDDRLTPVFDESIRRRTDRFILRFRKPR